MTGYIVRRLLLMVPTVFLVVTLTFVLMHIIPGDAVLAQIEEGTNLRPEQIALMREALQVTLTGDVHDAQHMIESMLSDVQPEEESLATLHLRLGLSGLRVDGVDEAIHHLEHAIADAEAGRSAEIEEILVFLAAGDLAEAEEHLAGILGQTPIGVDEHDDPGDDHETDDHDSDGAG